MLAQLPMYDWPEVAVHLDELWSHIAERLRAAGLDAPARLDRSVELEAGWEREDLLVGQTCGLPMAGWLAAHATVVAALDFGLDECPPGHYRSVVVCRRDDPRNAIDDFAGATVAFNQVHSHSGWGSMVDLVSGRRGGHPFFATEIETGSHRSTVQRIAADEADVAAVDEQSWRLAVEHEPASSRLRVLCATRPAPAPPIIVGKAQAGDAGAIADAVVAAGGALSSAARAALHLESIVPMATADYAVIAERIAAASPPRLA